jgi:hypothetical protein
LTKIKVKLFTYIVVRVITRQSFFNKYKSYVLGLAPIALILIGVAASYSLLSNQQDLRTRAVIEEKGINLIYDETLSSGWVDWSRNAENTFTLISPVLSGKNAIASFIKPGGEFYVHTDNPIELPYWSILKVGLQAGEPNTEYSIRIMDNTDSQIGEKVYLSENGGDPEVGVWKTYSISLSDFGVINRAVGGIIIQDESGLGDRTLYIDDIRFITSDINVLQP